jgi:hypothetical protein
MQRKHDTELKQQLEQEQLKQKQRRIDDSHWELSKETIERLLGRTQLKVIPSSEDPSSTRSSPIGPRSSSTPLGRRSFGRFNPQIEDVSYSNFKLTNMMIALCFFFCLFALFFNSLSFMILCILIYFL